VKLHGDAVWRDLSALRYHFMTQPLPTVSAWWAHQLPPGILRAMTAAALAIEVIAPLLVFGGPRARRVAAAAIVVLQLAIAATGNYGFFNLLTIVLCVALLDDDAWRWLWRSRWQLRRRGARSVAEATSTTPLSSDRPPLPRRRRPIEAAVVVLVLWLTAAPLVLAAGWYPPAAVAAPLLAPFVALSSWRIVNPYGLFADMTTTRPELRIEGTADGVAWRPYDLHWLPGDVQRAPRLAGVHMPRLDWQLWFAALQADGGGGAPDWLVRFLDRLKAGEPTVTALLARDPFAGRAPLAVRAVLVLDRFTTVAERRAGGAWWVRTGGVTVITR
ncbi:MAG: lipase maturation factor family protein, partial [Ardenticatenales bacterium]